MDIRFQSVIPNVQLEKEVGLLHFLQGRDGVLGDRDELRRRLREDRLADAGLLLSAHVPTRRGGESFWPPFSSFQLLFYYRTTTPQKKEKGS